MIRLACFFAALALPLQAQVVPGRYYIDDPDLCYVEWGADGSVIVEANRVRFIEGACGLSAPVSVSRMSGAVLYDADCSLEGTAWQTRLMLMNTRDGGLVIVYPGRAETYARCPYPVE